MNSPILSTLLVCLLMISRGDGQELTRKQEAAQARAMSRSIARLVASGGGELLRNDLDSVELPNRVAEWLKQNKAALSGASAVRFASQPKWGVATTRDDQLFLHVLSWPDDNKLLIPRMHNSVENVTLLGDSAELTLKPLVTDWEIALPEKPKPRESLLPIIALKLDGPAKFAGQTPALVTGDADGVAQLHSRYAITHGEMLRFEPQPHKNTVGYWVNESDWAEWLFEVKDAGDYEVELRYGCGDGQGGSQIEINIGEQQTLLFHVEQTGGFQAWRDTKVGNVKLLGGSPTKLSVKPRKKAKNAVMDIQQITLRKVN